MGAWVAQPLPAGAQAEALQMPQGQPPGLLLVFGAEPTPDQLALARRLFPSWELVTEPDAFGQSHGPLRSSEQLEPLREIDRLLAEARGKLAELDERAALTALSRAERLARSSLSLPLSAAFYAEVELQLAIAAAQIGHESLALSALRRAAWLAPERKLLAAEASPTVVAWAHRVWSEVTSAPEGELPIEVVDAPHAHVFVDDVDLGEAPRVVRANVGEHALRIEAPGRAAYGAVVEVAQGRRPVQRIALAADATTEVISSLERARESLDVARITRALRVLSDTRRRPVAALFLENDGLRSLLVACEPSACRAPERLDGVRVVMRSAALALDASTLESARAWLHARAPQSSRVEVAAEPVPFWKRWYVWSALAVIAAGTGTAIALAAAPAPEQRLRVVVDPTSLR